MGRMHAPWLHVVLVVLPSAHGRPGISDFPLIWRLLLPLQSQRWISKEIINLGVLITVAGCRTTRRMSRRPSPEPFAALQPTSRNAAFDVVHAPSNTESHAEKGRKVTDR